MARRYRSASRSDSYLIDGTLATMSADELRELVRDMLLELDDRAWGRVGDSLIGSGHPGLRAPSGLRPSSGRRG